MTSSYSDEHFMQVALDLAAAGQGFVEPNPMVGCVLVKDGEIIGQGYHQEYGSHHAEVEAIRSLASADDAKGCTAYVTLEPCCHHGKTPPCTRSLIDAKVSRVVIAMQDPFAKVDGGGISQLRDAGIEVVVGVLESDAKVLTAPFTKLVRTGRPWVIAKWAMTMDGRIATRTGDSQWISGPASRSEVHRLRSRVDAIVVGMGTVIADDPMLNARLNSSEYQGISVQGSVPNRIAQRIAQRVVLCHQRLPSQQSRLMETAKQFPTLLVTTPLVEEAELVNLESLAAKVLRLESGDRESMIGATLDYLGENGATNVMVEGGGEVLSSFFSANQIDEAHVYLGPKAFGGTGAAGPVGGIGVEKVADATLFELHDLDRFDDDVRLVYRRKPASK
ncbi:Riboflavin biosynthesis protein RibD [Rubripirellula obstinata]|uniref:Riboflavin biosynthesis protein RibD n=1 Tax=Rubripirellula obstinata TaxID=406547 RepID=A0A5B1CJX8_9BACT|nr:bifunctional diaminohydroxyphosphoribosylaminopyrimidine deaminase/5-amino-6-(5-phosphoribosylamino)uracil reductase RibD [Rubripirellula obstinata]KAA1259840.1 Riboflavin biosynthesis protein RibD [Rubripirellula obstinata]